MSNIQKNISVFSFAIIFTFIAMYLMFSATWVGAAGGLLAASFMSGLTLILGLITMAIQHQRNKNAFSNKQKTVDDMEVEQSRTIEIDLPFSMAFDIAIEALETLDGENIPKTLTGIPSKQAVKIHKADSGIGRIEAGLRAKTVGIQDFLDFSRIDIQLQRIDKNTTRLQIESRPSSSLEMYDLGRHTHYVNHLALTIRKVSQDYSAEENLGEKSEDSILDSSLENSANRLSDSKPSS